MENSLKKMVGQMIVGGFEGYKVDETHKKLLQNDELGGVILFKRNINDIDQVCELNKEIYSLSQNVIPIISIDEEGGRVSRLPSKTVILPSIRKLASRTDKSKIEEFGCFLAKQLAVLGFNVNFSPVADVDSNPDNPIIGDRSFSSNPDIVSAHVRSMITGMYKGGVMPCAKHFPGHGDTDVDSHLQLPILNHSMQRMNNIELLPFKKAVKSNVMMIMTAHILFKELDPVYPATLSPVILKKLLREQLGYNQVIITDDLLMKAIWDNYESLEIAKLCLEADIDILLICKNPELQLEIQEHIVKLVKDGIIKLSRIEMSFKRIQNFKKSLLKMNEIGKFTKPSSERFEEFSNKSIFGEMKGLLSD